jgi:hypothetical protein
MCNYYLFFVSHSSPFSMVTVISGFVLLSFRLVAPRREKLGQLNQC